MKFNTKTRYGIRTMIEISLYNEKGGIFQKDIAQHQHISVKYLDHIISSLKVAGLITRHSHYKGKYTLTKAPSEITLYDIYKAFENELAIVECLAPFASTCEREEECRTKCFWSELNTKIVDHFSSTTLEDLTKDNKI